MASSAAAIRSAVAILQRLPDVLSRFLHPAGGDGLRGGASPVFSWSLGI